MITPELKKIISQQNEFIENSKPFRSMSLFYRTSKRLKLSNSRHCNMNDFHYYQLYKTFF